MFKNVAIPLFLCLLLCFALVLASCTGDTGPAGATGAEGPTGPEGPGGEDATFTVHAINFTGADAGISGSSGYHELALLSITQNVIDHGCVIVYLNESFSSTLGKKWIMMPVNIVVGSNILVFNYGISLESIAFTFTTTAAAWPPEPTAWYHFKVIILAQAPPSSLTLESFDKVESYYLSRQRMTE
ncbi:MAG: hypothetical protein JXB45_06985 [Candidatus Krumholzibacteriota bacterium]|nr:hypothetical protein [Candidatus Krumholzibacteriota bacterium]